MTTKSHPTVLLGAGCGSWPRSSYPLGPEKTAAAKWTCECHGALYSNCNTLLERWQLMDGIPECVLGTSWCYQFWVIIIPWEGWRKTSFLPYWVALSSQTSCYNSLLILLCCFCVIAGGFFCCCCFLMLEVNLIAVGLLFIDGNSALTWTLAWSYWTEKHLHGVSLLVSELHFSLPLKDALGLLSSSVRAAIRGACTNFWVLEAKEVKVGLGHASY